MRHVFISYSRSGGDGGFALAVRSKLESRRFPCWQDVKLDAGEVWQEEIDRAIADSLAVVVILSPRSILSPYLNYEWAYALGAGKRVLPILLGVEERELHARLRSLHFLVFSLEGGPWDELIHSLDECAETDRPSTVRVPAGAPPAVRQAIEHLDGIDPDARAAAIRTLGAMTDRSAREALAGALEHPASDVRALAAKWLLQFGDRRAIPQLIENRRTARWDVVAEHDAYPHEVAAVGVSGVADLVAFLGDESADIREYVCETLARIADASAVPHVLPLLRDGELSVRIAAIRALGGMKDLSVTARLAELLGDASADVRTAAVDALAELSGPAALDRILNALDDPHAQVRNRAVINLGELKAVAAVQRLKALLATEKDEQTRKEAPRALGQIGDRSAVPDLVIAFRDDRSSMVRGTAKTALLQLRGPEAVAGLVGALADERARVRVEAADVLSDLKDPASLPALIELLRTEPDASVRNRVLAAVAGIGDAAAVPVLVSRLAADEEKDPDFCRRLAEVLEELGTPDALSATKTWRRKWDR